MSLVDVIAHPPTVALRKSRSKLRGIRPKVINIIIGTMLFPLNYALYNKYLVEKEIGYQPFFKAALGNMLGMVCDLEKSSSVSPGQSLQKYFNGCRLKDFAMLKSEFDKAPIEVNELPRSKLRGI